MFGDEVDHHRVGHHRGTEFVGNAGKFLERLLEDERDVLAQVLAGDEEEGVAEDVGGAAADGFLDGDGDERAGRRRKSWELSRSKESLGDIFCLGWVGICDRVAGEV